MESLIIYALSVSGFSTLAIWLGKVIINRSFDLGLEKYKSTLVKEVEEHKSQLSKITLEHQVKFTKLHNDRASKIQNLYLLVVELEKALIQSTSMMQGPEYITSTDKDKYCIVKIQELIKQLDEDRIYFSQETIKKFDTIIKESWEITFKMKRVREFGLQINNFAIQGKKPPEIYLSETDLWINANERTELEFKILKEELTNEFRQLLGI